jgi:eukaryotic-like serine/threonine-protein kinase
MITELGRYKILQELGQGAMGTVYKAVDPIIDRTVAIKTIKLDLSVTELAEYEGRFQQEIKATGKLTHPNIVTIFDVGRSEKIAYMAMEFLEGRELKEIIASGELLQLDQTADVIAQIADGLAFAHERGVIHRDIKPSNIMVLKTGLAKITDFGIARLPNASVKTMTGMILGSPRYMSPEQVIGSQLDHRSDIFSLGVVLYEALTGIAPFDGDNVNAIMYATVNTTQLAPSKHNPAIPQIMDLIVAKALAKDVESRYSDARQMSADLREVWKQVLGARAASGLQITQPMRAISAALPTQASALASAPAPAPAAAPSSQPEPPGSQSGIGKPGEATMATGSATAVITAEQRSNLQAQAEEARRLSLAQGFDSSEAMINLLSKTNQVEEFQEYVTATQQMRAYKIKESAARLQAANDAKSDAAGVKSLDDIIGKDDVVKDMRSGKKKPVTKQSYEESQTNTALKTLGIVMIAAVVLIGLVFWLVMKK